jgi:hypothetical protein
MSMFTHLVSFLVVAGFSTSALAAKFTPVKPMKNAAMEKLAQVVESMNKDEESFGDAGSVVRVTFTRKPTEQDLNTVKQLNFQQGDLFHGEVGAVSLDGKSADEMIAHILYAVENVEAEREAAFAKAKKQLKPALRAIKRNKSLKIYGAGHADEDGSRQILNVFDTKNNEILFVMIGYHGT